jgi:hypothetical protein
MLKTVRAVWGRGRETGPDGADSEEAPEMRNLRVAAVQFEHVAGDKRANLGKIRHWVEAAARQGVELIAFPECSITGYWFLRNLKREEFAALAEPVIDGPSSRELLALASEYGMSVGAGLIEAGPDGKFYKAYVVAMPDGQAVRHRKLHAFVSPYLTCGEEYTVFDTPHGCRAGVLKRLGAFTVRKFWRWGGARRGSATGFPVPTNWPCSYGIICRKIKHAQFVPDSHCRRRSTGPAPRPAQTHAPRLGRRALHEVLQARLPLRHRPRRPSRPLQQPHQFGAGQDQVSLPHPGTS